MSWHTDQLKYAFGLGGIMSFYGIVSLVVWFASEHLKRPVSERIVIIALVLITLPIALVIGWAASRRKKKEEIAAAAGTPQETADTEKTAAAEKLTAPTGNYDELTQSAEEAVQFLKNSNVGAGKDAVYALPWYLIAGSPKSGKTSLSLASGFDFQSLPSQRQSEQKVIRPTKFVDWRITDDAVFLDTAGRYQTEGIDGDEWSAVLETLKKYRGARPLDGMIVPVNTERILQADNSQIEQIAKVLRKRIDEAMQRTKVRFPIYLVFTHADAIEGFRDSFSVSRREGETLVWGATVPLEKSEFAHSLFDSEFDLLHSSIMKRRLQRLSAPFPPVRQLKIFNFPIHFGAARKKLGAFVSTLFRPNPFNENPFLRGFYFTAVPVNRPQIKGGQTMTNSAQTVGQTYFTQKLFRDVILRDKDLVATFQAQKVKPPILSRLLIALGAFAVLTFLGFSAYSLYQNKLLVDDAARRGEEVLAITKAGRDRNPLTKTPEETREEIDKIENLRQSLETLDKYEREGAPFWLRFGLYSGNTIYLNNLLPIYISAAEQRFGKPSVAKLEDDLRKFAASSPVANSAQLTPQEEENLDKHYELLKTYLMLSGEQEYRSHAESEAIRKNLADYWVKESKTPAGMEPIALENLKFWAKQTDRTDRNGKYYIVTSFGPNEKLLVDGARKNLQAFPAVFKYYKNVTGEISKKIDPVGVDSILAGRNSGVLEGSVDVRGAYTVEGYRNYMMKAIADAQTELTKNDWVMGDKAANTQAQAVDIQRLQDKYFNDYTENWKNFVRGISVKPYDNASKATSSLKSFSSAESPMKIVLEEVSRQTNLSAEPKSEGWIDWFLSFFKSKQNIEVGTLTNVEKEFSPLFGFTNPGKGNNSPSQLSLYGGDFKKLSDDLESRTPDQIRQITEEIARGDEKGFSRLLKNTETSINNKLTELEKTPAGQDIVKLLKKPLNNLKDLFGAGIQTRLEREWTETVLPKAKNTEKGFPFTGEGEADLTALSDYLNPQNGKLTEFYNKNLKQYFEESNGQLRVKETSEVKFSEDFVKYLNNAFRLRDTLFGKNSSPQFAYEFKLQKSDAGIIEVTIDGQKTDSNGTGSVNWKFPAQGGETGAFINSGSSSENASTSGTALPSPSPDSSANSSNSNVAGNTSAPKPTPQKNAAPPEIGMTSMKFPGNWGLFKFFDAGAPKRQPSGEYLLTYKLGGKTVTATIKPSGGDLFDRTIFTSVRAPEKFLMK